MGQERYAQNRPLERQGRRIQRYFITSDADPMHSLRKHLAIVLLILPSAAFAQARVEWASLVIDFSSQKGTKEYSAEQILGKPDKCPASGDSPCAWVPATDDGVVEE